MAFIYLFPREYEVKQGAGTFGQLHMCTPCLVNSNKNKPSAMSPFGHRSDSRLTEDRNEVT